MHARKPKPESLGVGLLPPDHAIHESMFPIEFGTPDDKQSNNYTSKSEDQELRRKQKQYYDYNCVLREPLTSPQNRVAIECIVATDIKTNVIVSPFNAHRGVLQRLSNSIQISDEYDFITGLSAYLAELYQRPESSIVVTLQHTSCLLFSGSFDPAYVMTVTSIQQYLEPALNNHNAAALQTHMQESVGVLPERGLVKFEILAESNIARTGKTLRFEIADFEKKMNPEFINFNISVGSTSGSKSMRTFEATRNLPTQHELKFCPPEIEDGAPPPPPILREKIYDNVMPTKAERLGRRKSIGVWMFGKGVRHG